MRKGAVSGLAAVLLLAACSLGTELERPAPPPAPEPATVVTTEPTTEQASDPATAEPVAATDTEPTHTESATEQIVAVVGVVDGDGLRVSVAGVTERLRVIGIDAPELSEGECYAQAAASRMQSLVQSQDVRIVADPTQDDRDRYGRILRHVFTLDGTSVAEAIIADGLAREYTYDEVYASRDSYLRAQQSAQAENLGIWSGECDVVLPAPVPLVGGGETGECLIKGNISSKKERIYHVPGQRHYNDTVIDELKGEAWFCTEEEAVQAGWRKSKR